MKKKKAEIQITKILIENVALKKMQTMMQPLLMYLGLKVLTPSMIIITVNLMVLNFNGMMGLIVSLGLARYGYKMYTNYLINSENMMIKSNIIQTPKEIISQKVVEQAPIVINTETSSGTNWWL